MFRGRDDDVIVKPRDGGRWAAVGGASQAQTSSQPDAQLRPFRLEAHSRPARCNVNKPQLVNIHDNTVWLIMPPPYGIGWTWR